MDAFEKVESLYEGLGEKQALWAVMTYPEYKDDKNLEEFFETGVAEIKLQMDRLNSLGITVQHGSCLDFGCGVGRLTNALGAYFSEATGVDVSSTMVEKANQLKKLDHVKFVLNKRQDLQCLEDQSFDFVYSNKTLQHIPYPAAKNYIQDFVRLLKSDGVAAFLVHDCKHAEEGSFRFNLQKWYRESMRPFLKKLRGKPPVQIHPISRRNIEKYVSNAGGKVIHWETDLSYTRRKRGNLRTWYWVKKDSSQ